MRITVSLTACKCLVVCCLFLNSCSLVPGLTTTFAEKYNGLSGLKIEEIETVNFVVLEEPKPVLGMGGPWFSFTVAKDPAGKNHYLLVWPNEDIHTGDMVSVGVVYIQAKIAKKGEHMFDGRK